MFASIRNSNPETADQGSQLHDFPIVSHMTNVGATKQIIAMTKIFCTLVLLLGVADVNAFTGIGCPSQQRLATRSTQPFRFSSEVPSDQSSEEEEERPKLDAFLEKKYPAFYSMINDEMANAIKKGTVTVFVPNEAAFENLGEKKTSQINDPRNLEIREKMGSYHIIAGKSVDAMTLRTEDWSKGKPKDGSRPNTIVAGINTLSGEVPVGRSKSGGFFGWGAKEDGTTKSDCCLYIRSCKSGTLYLIATFVSLRFR